MFARKVAARLKPNSLPQFKNLIECEVLPWLRQQQGFLHLLILAARDCGDVATISFWDHEADAGRHDLSGSPEVLSNLGTLLDGRPYARAFRCPGSGTMVTKSPAFTPAFRRASALTTMY